jgi:hypothetical protein
VVSAGPETGKRKSHGKGRLMLALVCVTLLAGGYWAGVQHGTATESARLGQVDVERDQLEASVIELRKQYQSGRQQQISLERGRAIDEQALNQARQSIVELETRNAQLRSDLVFYKRIMAPTSVANGLQIDSLSVDKNLEEGFDFRLVLTQVGNNKRYQSGLVTVNLLSQSGDSADTVSLRDVSPQIDDLAIKFRFRYFQDINGSLTLPDSFEPLAVEVVMQPDGEGATEIKRTFLWNKLADS